MTLKKYMLSAINLKNVKKVTFYELVNTTILEAKYVVRYCWPIIHCLAIEDPFPSRWSEFKASRRSFLDHCRG